MVEAATETKPDEGRKGDGVLLIAQSNARRELIIEEINQAALSRLGYTREDLQGRKLEVILGHQSALAIDEDLEYDEHAPDIADVLARHRELRLRLRSGKEIGVAYRINRLMAQSQQSQFQLILPNDREAVARQQLREFLKVNLEGHQQIDAVSGLPDRPSLEAFIGRVQTFSTQATMDVGIAVIRIDRWEKSVARYGQEAANHLLHHVVAVCRSTFRAEDVIAGLGERVGLMLIDISRESARVVLNRLRWNISSHLIDFGGKSDFSVTVSLAFAMLNPENGETVLSACEQALTALGSDARNALVELP